MIRSAFLRFAFVLAILTLGLSIPVHAQYPGYLTNSDDTGFPNYGAFVSSSIDTVNLFNQNLILHIPILSRKGRGIDYNATLMYQSKMWVVDTYVSPIAGTTLFNTTYTWRPNGGSLGLVTGVGGGVGYTEQLYTLDPCPYDDSDPPTVVVRSNWVYSTPDGTMHQLPLRKTYGVTGFAGCWSGFENDNFVAHTDDGQIQVDITADVYTDWFHSGIKITRQDGSQDGMGSAPFSYRDTNGNFVTAANPDTLGRQPITAGTSSYQYVDSNGSTQTISYTNTTLNITTAFPTTSYDAYHFVHQFSGNITVTSSITLANGLSYTFSYDDPASPGHPNPFGEITKITLPTGGYIKYKWATIAQADPGPQTSDPIFNAYLDSRVIVEKDVSEDGSTEHVWTYGGTGPGIAVIDPLGNQEIHVSGSCGTYTGSTAWLPTPLPLEGTVIYKDASGHTIKTVANDYGCDVGPVYSAQPGQNLNPSADYTDGFRNSRITRSTVTLGDTGQVSKSETDYTDCYSYSIFSVSWSDCRINPTETREYDYGTGSAGPLVRKTDTSYFHNQSIGSAYLTGHIWNRVYEKDVYDGPTSALIAATQYNYDSTAITSTSSSVPQHDDANFPYTYTLRGNVTEIKRLLTSTSAWLTTYNYYNDVGNLVQTTDPGGHTYYLSYADNFTDATKNGNSQGFLTKVTGPMTGTVNHIEGKQYYWDTGLTAAVCGQNWSWPTACTNSSTPTYSVPVADYAKYTYDLLGRPASVTHGDGGVTTFCFSDNATPPTRPSPYTTCHSSSFPITVSSDSAIDESGSNNLQNTVVIDGLGRVVQTQLTSDPDGTDVVDTIYDEVGRVSTASNPHRSTSAPTDGTSTNYYDGVGRITKLVPPDGSSSANNVQTFYHGNSITAVDQTGKARRSYTDALGRLTEVDEPAAGSALPAISATAAAGAVTITGGVQSKGHMEIVDYECTGVTEDGDCWRWSPVWGWITDAVDSGTVIFTANGHTDSTSYGPGTFSTASSIATALNTAINADSGAYVTSSLSGTTLTITAKTGGAGTDYLFGISSTWDTADFGSPSFGGTGGGTLADGADGVPSFPPSETPAAPYVTLYTYDALNNLTCVEQHGNTTGTGCSSATTYDGSSAWRVRRFAYDSVGRMTSSTNPESGTSTFTYDSDGNLLTKTSPKPNQTTSSVTVTTTLTYDALHRVLTKSFSDGTTPSVTIAYDGSTISGCSPTLTAADPIGRRTSMCDAAGWEAWSYDSRGHVITERRNTNSVTKSTAYSYNFHGGVKSITYPSGRTVTYTYNSAGQTGSASDVANSITYASNAHYNPAGALATLQESGSNIISTMYYNNRLQPCRISVKSSGTAPSSCTDTTYTGNVMDFTYGFNSGSANNGNVASITNNINTARSQTYTYDELNRVTSALTQATSGTYCWGEVFGYDPWANLKTIDHDSAHTATGCGTAPLSVTPYLNNHLVDTGFAYDAAGNLTSDPTNSSPNSYTYNAEGELTSAAGVTYTFDGDGSRVKKSSGKLYWYGNGTDPLSESDASGNISNEYIFLSGARIAMLQLSSSTVNYYVADHLGSSRIVTNSSGTVLDDSDFYPFGGERSYSASSGNNYKFTGKERDAESGLDDFAGRFYTSNYGRFLSPDESKYAIPADPQTWNLYGYVANNPINAVDPTGHALRYLREEQPGNVGLNETQQAELTNGETVEDTIEDFQLHEIEAEQQAQQQNQQQAQRAVQNQQIDNQPVGNTTVGSLGKVLTNEDSSLSTPKKGDPDELVNGKTALANAIYNNADLDKPQTVAPATGTPATQDAQIMRDVYASRTHGGADPIEGRHYYGTSHHANLKDRSAGNGLKGNAGRETVYAKFGPFKDSTSKQLTYIYIYNDPGH